jgi:endonuclease YncB( thermonuclease family)
LKLLSKLAFLAAFFLASLLPLVGCLGENGLSNPFASPNDQALTPSLKPGETPQVGSIASVKVAKVFDGDTFEFLQDGRAYSVRLSGIDAPERTQEFADQARKALKTWTEGQAVRIEVLKIDTYKRLVCRVIVESGQYSGDVSLRLLDQGLAWHFKRYVKDQAPDDQQRYALAESKARAANLGLWATPQALAPWTFREQQRTLKAKPQAPS